MKKIGILILVVCCLLTGFCVTKNYFSFSTTPVITPSQQEIDNMVWQAEGWRYVCKFNKNREIGLLYYRDKVVTLFRFTKNEFKFEDGDRIVTPWGQMQFFVCNNRWGFFPKVDETGHLFTLEQVVDVREDDGMER